MSDTNTKTRARRRLVLPVAVLAVAASGLVALTTGAVFSDTQSNNGSFTAGTVTLGATPANTVLTLPNAYPGEYAYGQTTVQNTGSLASLYSLDAALAGTGNPADMEMTIKRGVTACTAAGFGASGTVVTGPAPIAGTPIVDRALAAGDSDVLCFKVGLKSTADNTAQGKNWTATFTYNAKQAN